MRLKNLGITQIVEVYYEKGAEIILPNGDILKWKGGWLSEGQIVIIELFDDIACLEITSCGVGKSIHAKPAEYTLKTHHQKALENVAIETNS